MKSFFYTTTLFIVMVLSGCSTHKVVKPIYISQDVENYTKGLDTNISLSFSNYKEHYFTPWYLTKPTKSLKEISWAFTSYEDRENYGANLCLLKKSFFTKMRENANFKAYGNVNKIAITLDELDLRAMPTSQPLFADPKKAGEGFPFDYLQNSTIHQNKPLFVTHYSKDREWVHVESSFTYGWVKVKDIKFISKAQRDLILSHPLAVVQKENIAFYDKENRYIGKTKFGMLLPIVSESKIGYQVAFLQRDKQKFSTVEISKDVIHKDILHFNKQNVTKILSQLLKNKYGWGGMNGERDCSSTLRDFYAPFGLWLPRNSSQQAKVGTVVSLDTLNEEERIALIKKRAIPFRTLLYKRGHILLYVGYDKDDIIVFQNMWGIRTLKSGKSGRYIIGKALFSKLEFGENLEDYDSSKKMIEKLKSFNILF